MPTLRDYDEHEILNILLVAARSDARFGHFLTSILQMEHFQRESYLNSCLSDMTLQNAPTPFILAVEHLKDPLIASKALTLISKGLSEPDDLFQNGWKITGTLVFIFLVGLFFLY